jgi:hypothetical protein
VGSEVSEIMTLKVLRKCRNILLLHFAKYVTVVLLTLKSGVEVVQVKVVIAGAYFVVENNNIIIMRL